MSSVLPENPEELTELVSWVRGLARRLASDGHETDDLAQEAWVEALRAPPGEVRSRCAPT